EKCCDVMKKRPMYKYQRETGRRPFLGIVQDESIMRRRTYEKTGCNIIKGKHPQSKPLGFWTSQDILRYIVENNLDYCSIYGEIKQNENGEYFNTGVERTGCMFCLFGVHMEKEPNRFQRMAVTHPKLYDYCMRGGEYVDGVFKPKNGLGYRELQYKIGVKLEKEDLKE
ncbi:MAG: phosphoadenosine phosphosulfate reductase family protein, partial [Acutalibacteraceae bacterium]